MQIKSHHCGRATVLEGGRLTSYENINDTISVYENIWHSKRSNNHDNNPKHKSDRSL